MTLYINRWTKPGGEIHVFNLDPNHMEVVGENPNHTAAVRADYSGVTALCGRELADVNDTEPPVARTHDLLRVSRVEAWDGLADFVGDDGLCMMCGRRLLLEWPPAQDVLDVDLDTTEAVVVSESPNEVVVDTGSEKFALDPEDVPAHISLGHELEWYDSDLTPLEDAA